MTLSIAIAGVAGRMGGALIRATGQSTHDLRLVGGTERAGSAALGTDLGAIASTRNVGVAASDSAATAAKDADVWIDFTAPDASLAALDALAGTKVRAAIIGTTGLTPEQEARIQVHANRLAIVRSNNFSLGVNLLAALVREAASKLREGWDIEIVETHHRRKVDAPSGTALLLGEAAAEGRGKPLADLRLPAREGITGARPEGAIGFAALRGGGVVGEHSVMLAAERESITLSHQALDRAVFADGALAAAVWAAGQPPGALLDGRRARIVGPGAWPSTVRYQARRQTRRTPSARETRRRASAPAPRGSARLTFAQHARPGRVQHPMRRAAIGIDRRHVHASRADAHNLKPPRIAIVHAKRQPQGQHVEAEETGDGNSALRRKHRRNHGVRDDHYDQHDFERRCAQAAVRAQHGVHEQIAIHLRRRGRAFPTGRHCF
ncbi:MAG: 4-hydroxy-tetrahydrodipicolinate reductase [Hyphomonadaceae bacterium]